MERVSSYVSGTMTPDQRLRFEADLQTDASLQEQLNFQQDLARVVERRAMMKEIHAVSKQYGGGGSSFFSAWGLSVIGGILVAAGITAYFLFEQEPKDKPQQLTVVTQQPQAAQTDNPSAANGTEPVAAAQTSAPVQTLPAPNGPHNVFDMLRTGTPADRTVPGTRPTFVGVNEALVQLEAVDFAKLDFTPRAFREKLLSYQSLLGAENVSQEWIDSVYYTFGQRTEFVYSHTTEVSGKWWMKRTTETPLDDRNGEEVPGIKGYHKIGIKRNKAYCVIVDAKGDKWDGLEIAYGYFGEDRKAKTDSKGAFEFQLYSPIKSAVTISLPGRGELTLPEVEFEPKRITYIQVDLDADKMAVTEAKSNAGRTCGINPAAIRAIRGEAFQNTFLATRAFEKRLQLLHDLENGQQLLNVYVEHLNMPLCDVDRMVSSMIDDKEYAIAFSALSNENLNNVPGEASDQQAMVSRYRSRMDQFSAKKLQVVYDEDQERERKVKMYRELSESLTPCDNSSDAMPQTPKK